MLVVYDDFFLAADESNYDLIVLIEINSAPLFGNQFTDFRNDRSRINSTKSRYGGVMIPVSKSLSSCLDPALEQLWVKITAPHTIVR